MSKMRNRSADSEIWNEVRRVAGGDMSVKMSRWSKFSQGMMLMSVMAWTSAGAAQEAANRTQQPSAGSSSESLNESVRELREQVRALQAAVDGMRSDWQQSRAETAELRRELDEVRAGTGPRAAAVKGAGGR